MDRAWHSNSFSNKELLKWEQFSFDVMDLIAEAEDGTLKFKEAGGLSTFYLTPGEG